MDLMRITRCRPAQEDALRVLGDDGSRHHGVGIQPTIPVSRTSGGVAAGWDEMIERAIALLEGR